MGAQKMSRKRLSEKTVISRPSLTKKLDGEVAFTYDELMRVVEVLGVNWEQLLTETGGDSPLADVERSYEPTRLRDFEARPDRSL